MFAAVVGAVLRLTLDGESELTLEVLGDELAVDALEECSDFRKCMMGGRKVGEVVNRRAMRDGCAIYTPKRSESGALTSCARPNTGPVLT